MLRRKKTAGGADKTPVELVPICAYQPGTPDVAAAIDLR